MCLCARVDEEECLSRLFGLSLFLFRRRLLPFFFFLIASPFSSLFFSLHLHHHLLLLGLLLLSHSVTCRRGLSFSFFASPSPVKLPRRAQQAQGLFTLAGEQGASFSSRWTARRETTHHESSLLSLLLVTHFYRHRLTHTHTLSLSESS